jgi:hypothetical protein
MRSACVQPVGSSEAQARALVLPAQRPVPQQLGQPQPLGLPAVEDRLDEVGGEAGERQEAADLGVGDALLLDEVELAVQPVELAVDPLRRRLEVEAVAGHHVPPFRCGS